jgi:sulfur transfer protein SufE
MRHHYQKLSFSGMTHAQIVKGKFSLILPMLMLMGNGAKAILTQKTLW